MNLKFDTVYDTLCEDLDHPTIIPYSRDLKIVNTDQLAHGTGARYLEVIRGEGDILVAKQWCRKPVGKILIDFKPHKAR